jgi:hypothetical protein
MRKADAICVEGKVLRTVWNNNVFGNGDVVNSLSSE